ncbi:hypothetical protein GCM10027422_15130 [Hymenobacter arcticus]
MLLLLVLVGWASAPAHALQGNIGLHDPSTIIKDGNKYWIFYTGQGIPSKYSTDLINWTQGPRPVFTQATRPSWISARVPSFVNEYWAPDVIYMNGKFYLYYSCSTFGSQASGIGLATNVTLDPTSPNYNWVDQGEVVSSASGAGNSAPNAIDPAMQRDATGNLWFSYGSFFGGIRILQLDLATGKPLNGASTQQYAVANNGVEASYMKQHGNYYYLFINRGNCCQGSNSTYYILVGRSTSPTGPFLDKTGANLNSNGGTVLLNVSGRFVGPGHTGIFEENGTSYFSHHFYDFYNNGTSKLDIAKLTWDATDWPVVSRDWVAPSRYTIATAAGSTSGLAWQSQGCTGAAGQGITQGTRASGSCQQWDFTALGDGDYQIKSALGGLTASVAGCSASNSALLQLDSYTGQTCQQFHINQASDGSLVFASANGNRVVEVPAASNTAGTQLGLFDYNGCVCQHWFLTATGGVTATAAPHSLLGATIYPVPALAGSFVVELGSLATAGPTSVEIFNLQGQLVYQQQFGPRQTTLAITAGLGAGLYVVQVRRAAGVLTQKVSVL